MKYRTVVIDPAWKVACGFDKDGFFHGQNNERTLPYQTMTDKEIHDFPIDDFADAQCDLFMWTTHTKLKTSLEILQAWGFKYHCLITWDKKSGVCIQGFYRRTELVIYAYRGKMGVIVGNGKYIPTLFSSKATGHSEKPSSFYAFLRKRTSAPRIDIFARKRHFGFDSWGNQVETQMQIPLEITFSGKET